MSDAGITFFSRCVVMDVDGCCCFVWNVTVFHIIILLSVREKGVRTFKLTKLLQRRKKAQKRDIFDCFAFFIETFVNC